MHPAKKTGKPRPTGTRSRATVAIGFVHGMLSGLSNRGADAEPEIAALLEQADIPLQVLDDASSRVPVERYAALYNLINHHLDDEAFGLFNTPMRVGSFEFLCRSVITAPVLGEALERSARFLHLLLPDLEVELEHGSASGKAQLTISERHPASIRSSSRIFAFEWLLRLLHGLSSWLVGRSLVLDKVSFPYARPAHGEDYALIYTAHSEFIDEANEAVQIDTRTLTASFAANLLDLPIRRDEAALRSFLVGAPGKLSTLYRRDREMVQRVRDCLRNALPESKSLGETARALHLSPRTLHRRLEEENSSFQGIKDALRRDLAINRLAKTQQSLAQIAADLGFSDPSAFYRAFLGWTGMAPAHYRQRLLQSAESEKKATSADEPPHSFERRKE